MFHIKICGIRRREEVAAVAAAGADAIGLNFFPPSIRFVEPSAPSTIELSRFANDKRIMRVGVFVNRSLEEIVEIADTVGLDAVQLHGDETVDFTTGLIDRLSLRVIRAIKLPTGPLDPQHIEAAAARWVELGCHPLLDAQAGAEHGGSGKTLDWDAVGQWKRDFQPESFTLAGGLNPGNVGEAMERSGASSVDTASGVEQPRGEKQPELIRAFVKACR